MARIISAILLANAGAILAAPPTGAHPQSRALEKACGQVAIEDRAAIETKAKTLATPTASLAVVSKGVRQWAKEVHPGVPEDCVIELVRQVVGVRDAEAKKRANDQQPSWDKLATAQKRWVLYRQKYGEKAIGTDLSLGQMGVIDRVFKVIAAPSPTDLLLQFEQDARSGPGQVVWLAGVNSAGYVSGQRYVGAPSGVYWYSRTTNYESAAGLLTVPLLERVPPISEPVPTPPKSAKIEDFDHVPVGP